MRGKDGFFIEESFFRCFSIAVKEKLLDICYLVKLNYVPFQSQHVNPSAYRCDSSASPSLKVEEMATVSSLSTLLLAMFKPWIFQNLVPFVSAVDITPV